MNFRVLLQSFLSAAILATSACGGGGSTSSSSSSSTCVNVDTSCSPLYPPTFDNIYSRTLTPTCAQPGNLCHSSSGLQGGLGFSDADTAYAELLGQGGRRKRVIAGDPSCSLLVERLESSDATSLMPPGSMLSAEERCVFVQWILDGAMR